MYKLNGIPRRGGGPKEFLLKLDTLPAPLTLLIAAQMTCDSPLLRPEIYHGNFVEYFTRIIAPLYKSHPYEPIYKTKTTRCDFYSPQRARFDVQAKRLNRQIQSTGILSIRFPCEFVESSF